MNRTPSLGNGSLAIKDCEIFGERLPDVHRLTSSEYIANHIVIIIIQFMMAILALALNFITILTIWGSKKLKKTLCFFLIMLQSCADLMIASIVMPMSIYTLVAEISPAPSSCTLAVLDIKIGLQLQGISMIIYFTLTFER